METQEKLLYRPKEVAPMLSVSLATVYNLIKQGKLSCVFIGTSPRISMEHIEDFIQYNTYTRHGHILTRKGN